jgi:hypothetical protein
MGDMGYAYDPRENVFYTTLDAWQRKYGYCKLYDEGIAPSGMIADCEPVYFTHDGTRYLIEFWKGQYGMTTGCEVGVYYDSGRELLGSEWFESVPDANLLDMSVTLYKNGERLFSRHARHWWLTGFVLGEFSNTRELVLAATLIVPDDEMRGAFLAALRQAGYSEAEAFERGGAVTVYFAEPKTQQPVTRTKILEKFTQTKNRLICEEFSRIVGGNTNMYDILVYLKTEYPGLYESAIELGRPMESFTRYMNELPGLG